MLHIMEQEKATVKCIFLLWKLCQNENKRKSQQPIISLGEKRKKKSNSNNEFIIYSLSLYVL